MKKKVLNFFLNKHRIVNLSETPFFTFESSLEAKAALPDGKPLFFCKGSESKECSFIKLKPFTDGWYFFNKLFVVESFFIIFNIDYKNFDFIFYRGLDGLVYNKSFLQICLLKGCSLVRYPYNKLVNFIFL